MPPVTADGSAAWPTRLTVTTGVRWPRHGHAVQSSMPDALALLFVGCSVDSHPMAVGYISGSARKAIRRCASGNWSSRRGCPDDPIEVSIGLKSGIEISYSLLLFRFCFKQLCAQQIKRTDFCPDAFTRSDNMLKLLPQRIILTGIS